MNLDHLSAGSRGDAVRALQVALNARGFPCSPVDGLYGAATEAAVLAYQRSAGLLADGIAGPRTQAALGLRDNPCCRRCSSAAPCRQCPGCSQEPRSATSSSTRRRCSRRCARTASATSRWC